MNEKILKISEKFWEKSWSADFWIEKSELIKMGKNEEDRGLVADSRG